MGNEKDAPDTGSNDGFGARRCTAVERTWFKGRVEIGPLCAVTGSRQCDSFCVRSAGGLGGTCPNHLSIAHDHCPNRRIRAGATNNGRCLLQSKGNKAIRCEALVMIIHRDTPLHNLRGIAGRTMKQRRTTGRCLTGTVAQTDKSSECALVTACSIVPDQPQTFSHPDYTVGPGIAPSPALRLAGLCGHATITADQEFHLAPKVFGLCRRSDIY
jgi:hypothetical protein